MRPVFLVLLTAGCAFGQAPDGQRPVTPDFTRGGGTWNSGETLIVAVEAREREGRVGVCAAWTVENQTANTLGLQDEVLETGVVEIAGDRIAQDLEFALEAPAGAGLLGRPAGCVVTDTPWRSAYAEAEPQILFPRQFFDFDDDSGFQLVFDDVGGRFAPRSLP